jgi:hypothetical protein
MMRRCAVLCCAVTLIAGCSKPVPAPMMAALPPPALASCPSGYLAVSAHAATAGANAGHGFVMVRYAVKGKPMHLFCTASTNVADPRRNTPAHSSIPDSESTKRK